MKKRFVNPSKLFLTISILISSCVEFDPGKVPVPPAPILIPEDPSSVTAKNILMPEDPSPVTVENFKDFLHVKVEPTVFAERYLIEFSWKKPSEILKIIVKFKKSFYNEEEFITINNNDRTSFSNEVPHNQSINYEFKVLKKGTNIEKSFTKLIDVPKDYVVQNNNNSLKEDLTLNVNRFFLPNGMTLLTNGHNLHIISKSFISDGGIIETFKENSYSPTLEKPVDISRSDWLPENVGMKSKELCSSGKGFDEYGKEDCSSGKAKSGGKIQITTEKAFGKVIIFMRGENGAEGRKGASFSPDARAGNGDSPEVGYSPYCSFHDTKRGLEQCVCFYTPPYKHANGQYELRSDLQPIDKPWLRGTPGKNGENGATGERGYNGVDGGDAGELIFLRKYKYEDDLILELKSVPGKGGNGGKGGEGQLGGIGLPIHDYAICGATKGLDGKTGKTGKDGKIGKDGEDAKFVDKPLDKVIIIEPQN